MAIANVAITDTFQSWVTKTNQLIVYTDQVNTQLQSVSTLTTSLPELVRWTANSVNSINNGTQVLNESVLANTTSITFKLDGTLQFNTKGSANVVRFVQQSGDDNFVMYTTNAASITNRPVFSIFANTNNSAFRTVAPLYPEGGIKGSTSLGYGQESFGNTGDVLVSGGGGKDGFLIHAPSGSNGSYVQWQTLPTISVKQFGAVANGVISDRVAIQNAINAANSTGSNVYFPAGIYSIDGNIDMRNRFVKLIGDGPTRSVIRSSQAMHTMIDLNQASLYPTSTYAQLEAAGDTPFSIEGIGFDGNFEAGACKANNALAISFRQNFSLKNLIIRNCNNAITEVSTVTGYHENISITNCTRSGFNLGDRNLAYRSAVTFAESNNYAVVKSSVFNACKISGNTALGIALISTEGTKFNGLEITNLTPVSTTPPYAANLYNSFTFNLPLGTAIFSDFSTSSIDSSRVGSNCSGPAIFTADGLVTFDRSLLGYGNTSNNVVHHCFWGTVKVQNSLVAPANIRSTGDFSTMRYIARRDNAASGKGGKISFKDCRIVANTVHSNNNNHVMSGDLLDLGGSGTTYAPRYGTDYSFSAVGSGAFSASVGNEPSSYNQKTFTVTSSGYTAISINAPLTSAMAKMTQMTKGENFGLIVVYSSNYTFRARFTQEVLGNTGKFIPSAAAELSDIVNNGSKILSLPSTNGRLSTLVRVNIPFYSPDVAFADFNTFNFFEFVAENPPIGAFLSLVDVIVVDNRFLNSGQAYSYSFYQGSDFANLHKI